MFAKLQQRIAFPERFRSLLETAAEFEQRIENDDVHVLRQIARWFAKIDADPKYVDMLADNPSSALHKAVISIIHKDLSGWFDSGRAPTYLELLISKPSKIGTIHALYGLGRYTTPVSMFAFNLSREHALLYTERISCDKEYPSMLLKNWKNATPVVLDAVSFEIMFNDVRESVYDYTFFTCVIQMIGQWADDHGFNMCRVLDYANDQLARSVVNCVDTKMFEKIIDRICRSLYDVCYDCAYLEGTSYPMPKRKCRRRRHVRFAVKSS